MQAASDSDRGRSSVTRCCLERKLSWLGRWLENSPGETAFTRWRLRRTLAAFGLGDIVIPSSTRSRRDG